MNTQLQKINDLIKEFNEKNENFELELRITNKERKKYMKLDQVMNIVCKATGLTPEYLNMQTRERHIILPRQIAHYMAAKNTKSSFSVIGAYFGNKDHATVSHSVKSIEVYLQTDREFREKYGELLSGRSERVNGNSL